MQRAAISLVFIVIGVGVGILKNAPSWNEVASGTFSAGANQATILEFELHKMAEVRVSAEEASGKQITAYWLNAGDHRITQSVNPNNPHPLSHSFTLTNLFISRVKNQTFFEHTSSGQGTAVIPKGKVFIYIEPEDGESPTTVDYKVSMYE